MQNHWYCFLWFKNTIHILLSKFALALSSQQFEFFCFGFWCFQPHWIEKISSVQFQGHINGKLSTSIRMTCGIWGHVISYILDIWIVFSNSVIPVMVLSYNVQLSNCIAIWWIIWLWLSQIRVTLILLPTVLRSEMLVFCPLSLCICDASCTHL